MEVTIGALLLLTLGVVNAEVCQRDGVDINTCTQCIWMSQDTNQRCKFCEDKDVTPGADGMVKGCITEKDSCSSSKILPNSDPDKTQNIRINADKDGQKIQPQKVTIKVIPGKEKEIDFKVTLGDAPVDIYFLFDSSRSMEDLKNKLKAAARNIVREVKIMTEDAQFGIGGYTDKPIVPFANEPQEKKAGDTDDKKDHRKVFAFQHHLSITDNEDELEKAINDITLVKNVDDPEANFDALAQAMLCEDIVGWRGDDIRKVIIMIGDEESKYAMDGMIAGIVKPFDMQCHTKTEQYLNDQTVTYYTKQLELDFPSFGQIRKLKRETETDIIFLTKTTKLQWFKDASKAIQDTDKNVAAFDDSKDEDHVTQIIKQQYDSIKSRVVVRWSSNIKQDDLKVTFDASRSSKCTVANKGTANEQVTCEGVKSTDAPTQLKAKIKVNQDYCFNKDSNNEVTIELDGQRNGKLTVKVECEECENCRPGPVANHPSCNQTGTLICGACDCNKDWSGRQCKCNLLDQASNNDKCDEDDTCNGQGECKCGKCKCKPDYLGTHCKCPTSECPGYDGEKNEVCSGHGECNKCDEENIIAECTCNGDWYGDDCSCPTDKNVCKDKRTQQVCMGHGTCECANGQRCKCHEGYNGKYCQRQQGDHNYCKPLLPCVIKKAYGVYKPSADVSEYKDQCDRTSKPNGQVIFGSNIKIACDLKDLEHVKSDGIEFLKKWKAKNNQTIEFLISTDMDCKTALEEFEKQKKREDDNGQNGGRGDGQVVDSVETRTTRFEEYGEFETCRDKDSGIGCYFLYYHSKIGSDHYFEAGTQPKDEIYIVFQPTDDGQWVPQSECSQIPIEQLMGISGGVALAILIVVITTAYLIVFYRDRKRWLKFEAEKKENERRFGENVNPLFGKNLDNL